MSNTDDKRRAGGALANKKTRHYPGTAPWHHAPYKNHSQVSFLTIVRRSIPNRHPCALQHFLGNYINIRHLCNADNMLLLNTNYKYRLARFVMNSLIMTTDFQLWADMVVLLHSAFVLFVLLGGLAVLRWRRLVWLHLPAALWGAAIELGGWVCPLTYLENQLRRAGGEADYGVTFIERYLEPILYPLGLTRHTQIVFGLSALLLNLLVYCRYWRCNPGLEADNEAVDTVPAAGTDSAVTDNDRKKGGFRDVNNDHIQSGF